MRLLELLRRIDPPTSADCAVLNELEPASPQIKAWMGNSKVIDREGNPLIVYHATQSFREFGKLRGLSHFGTLDAASKIVGTGDNDTFSPRFYPVYLKIENPIQIRDEGEGHDAYEYANSAGRSLDKIGLTKESTVLLIWSLGIDWNYEAVWKFYRFSDRLRNALENIPIQDVKAQSDKFSNLPEWQRLRTIVRYLENLGFDGFSYTNEIEDPGSTSWVPFRSSQIKYSYSEGLNEAPLQDFDFVQSSGRLDTPASRSFAPVPKRDPMAPEMQLRGPAIGGKSTRKADWAYLTDPRLRARTFKKFDKTPHNFKVVVYDTEKSGVGRVFTIPDWQNYVGEVEEFQFMMDFKPDPNAINIIYTNNQGANAVPFSPWIMMHRFSHMYDFDDAYEKIRDRAGYGAQRIMKKNYDPSHEDEAMMKSFDIFKATSGVGLSGEWANYVWDFFNSIGNFKSARKSNMTHAYEFFTELMPQYVLTGNISFRAAPEEILYRGVHFGDQKTASASLHPPMILQNPQQANQQLDALGKTLSKLYEGLLTGAVGKVHML